MARHKKRRHQGRLSGGKKKKVCTREDTTGSIAGYDQWIAPPVSGTPPPPRFRHGAAVIQDKMYVYGGESYSTGGIYAHQRPGPCFLGDLHVLDLKNWSWSKLVDGDPKWISPRSMTSRPGHSLIAWNNRLLLILGRTQDLSEETMLVKEFDLRSNCWLDFTASGDAPVARGGHSVNLLGNYLVIFGGEDARWECPLNDLHVLDLVSRKWSKPLVGGVLPAARFNHAATVHTARRELLIFGGFKYLEFVNDLYVLNIDTWAWSRPTQHGEIPGPRYGHAGATIGDNWFIVGGCSGTTADDLIVLNMSKYVWSVLPTTGECISATTMGPSLVASAYEGQTVLISFGGFSKCITNKVHILKPNLKSPLMTLISNETFDPRGTGKTKMGICAANDPRANKLVIYEFQYIRDQLAVEELKSKKLEAYMATLKQKLYEYGMTNEIDLLSGFEKAEEKTISQKL